MNKIIYLGLFTFLLIGCTNQSPAPSNTPTPQISSSPSADTNNNTNNNQQQIQSISSGTSFGMCMGYCNKEATFNQEKVVITQIANRGSKETYPDIKKEITFSANEWSAILQTIDINKFNTLPERIGCPDCADGGAEWIEIVSKTGTKKVTFEFNNDVPEIQNLVVKMRDLRDKYLAQLNN